jgi:predicted dienelactone hydrolase
MLKKRFLILLLIVVLLAPMSALAQDGEKERKGIRPDAPTYGVRGPHPVGVLEFVIEDEERPIPVTVWYPALNLDGAEEIVTYRVGVEDILGPELDQAQGHALRDAAPDLEGGPYPLVVNSHGTGGTYLAQAYLGEHIASYGFVFMAPKHLGTEIRDSMMASSDEELIWGLPANDFIDGHYLRAEDMERVIAYADTLNVKGPMAGVIDTESVAVSGYSGGGYTALAAAGARIDFDALRAWCSDETNSQETSPGYVLSCALPAYGEQLAALFGGDVDSGELWPAVMDPRVDAVVAFAPGRVPAFGPEGLSSLTVPMMILTGTNDLLDWAEDNAYVAYEHVGSEEKSLVVFEDAGHMIFGQCPEAWLSIAFGSCSDAVWDIDRTHDLIDHFTTAFLLWELKGDEDAKAALMPEAVSFPGITYEATFE